MIADLGMVGSAAGRRARCSAGSRPASTCSRCCSGLVATSDLVYFVVIIGSFLLLTKASVESVRWR